MEALNEYFNLTSVSTQLMKEKVPWRGGREKDYESMQILIEALRTPSFVALDAYASTFGYLLRFSGSMILVLDMLVTYTKKLIS